MKLSSDTLPIVPTDKTERIVDIDILRGLALFGILVVNIFYFCAPDAFYTRYFRSFTSSWDDDIFHIVNFLFTGKFYPVFSFLFGLGFFIQFSKLRQREMNARPFFIRRLTILLLFGVMHVLFVWEEDILLFYALFGFVLIFLIDKSPRVILVAAAIAYALPVCFETLNIAFHFIPQKYTPFSSLAGYIAFYTTATYWQILQVRLALYAGKLFTLGGFVHHLDRLAFFLFGLYAGKKELIADLRARKNHWMRLWIWAFIFGIVFQALWIEAYERWGTLLLLPISRVIASLFLLAHIFTYIVGVLLLLKIKIFNRLIGAIAYPGRMALTNYLMGTITFSLMFYSYGFGLYAGLSPVQLIAIVIMFYSFQVVFSNIWLRYFRYGPLEWVWRSFTYRKILPIKLSARSFNPVSPDSQ
jgi:uncharacterized protein